MNTSDLFAILDAGKFNHPELGPATWGEGDFTGDTLVNSADLFAILAAANFNQGPYTSTPPDSGSSLSTTTATASTSLLSTIEAGDESGTDDGDQFTLASNDASYLVTYGLIARGQASHRPNSAPLGRSANANASTIDDSGHALRTTARLKHFAGTESFTRAASERTRAVDDLMRSWGAFTQARKENSVWGRGTLDLSDSLLEDLTARW